MARRPLRATYRLQLHEGFTFADARRRVPSLAALGVSHLYLSPIFEAAKGSTHGYDVVDLTAISQALGGRAGFEALVTEAHAHGLGLILDIVPNHMSIADERNRWWWDVLENGPSSQFARAFDVDWDPPERQLANLVLLPVLGDHRHKVLARGELRVEREGARFCLCSGDRRWPVAPRSLGELLRPLAARSSRLAFLADALAELPAPTATELRSVERRHRDKAELLGLLRETLEDDPTLAQGLDAHLAGVSSDPEALGRLLDQQNYRLAYWRTADRELDYRRFFDVNNLVALRMEDRWVFDTSHALIIELARSGAIDGVRVDHVDGLADPAEYLRRLRAALGDVTVHVEKILAFDEQLPAWPIEGTTGYEHGNELMQLFLAPQSRAALEARQAQLTDPRPFEVKAAEGRAQVLVELLASDVNRLTETLIALRERHAELRDYGRHELQRTLRALVAAFPVYRTYIAPLRGEVSAADHRVIDTALERAGQAGADRELLQLLGSFLTLERKGELEALFVQRFQQLTAPATAKGVEDTAFYRDTRLLALNEVGGSPQRFGLSVDDFHARQREVQQRWPSRLNAVSTHDTKRSADVRAQLIAASWRAEAIPFPPDGPIDGLPRELALQNLLGAWPLEADRLWPALEKSLREAKQRTSWLAPDTDYEARVHQWLPKLLEDEGLRAFARQLAPAAEQLSRCWTVLHLTLPGVPDLYQGDEVHNRSLVDPDNRRPVDFEALASSDDPKLELVRRLLRVRREHPEAFDARGTYAPLPLQGRGALGFTRGSQLAVVLRHQPGTTWQDATVELPAGARWVDLEGRPFEGKVPLPRLLIDDAFSVLQRA